MVLVTQLMTEESSSGDRLRINSRNFIPWEGMDEDPVVRAFPSLKWHTGEGLTSMITIDRLCSRRIDGILPDS